MGGGGVEGDVPNPWKIEETFPPEKLKGSWSMEI